MPLRGSEQYRSNIGKVLWDAFKGTVDRTTPHIDERSAQILALRRLALNSCRNGGWSLGIRRLALLPTFQLLHR